LPWKYKVPILYALYAVWMFIFLTILMLYSSYIAHYWPFLPMWTFALTGGPFLIWWAVQATMLIVMLRAASPKGVTREPDWRWR